MQRFPGRLVNVGIAEQTLVGTAAGLAIGGKIAVTCNAAPFLISRANEQIKVDICYNNTNVKLFGLNAGASYGPLASTHHSIDDIAIMRGFGNIEIYAPSSPNECRQIIDYALEHTGPVYIRLDGKALPELHEENYRFQPGKIDQLRAGHDVALVAMGSTVHEIVEAAAQLAAEGIDATVISVPSIRPQGSTIVEARIWCEHCQLEADPVMIEAAIRMRITELISREGKAIEGVHALMDYLRRVGYRMALATSSSYEIVGAVLAKLGIGHYFEVICSADDERYGKPHPDVYLSALRKLGLAAGECIVIEDSQSGYRAAISAGLKTLIVSPACHHTAFTDASGRYASMYALLDALAAPVPVAG
jgi:transketolase